MSAAPVGVCQVEEAWDRSQASDGISRYGAYLRTHTDLFDPWSEAPEGITQDPGEFALAAFEVACGPIMSPGYVGWHPRVLDHRVSRGENPEPGRLVCSITLATYPGLWLGSPWRGWTSYLGRDWWEPDDAQPAALARLELRWPLQVASLPRPGRPARAGYPNLADAKASVRALVDQFNRMAGPVLAKLEGGEPR